MTNVKNLTRRRTMRVSLFLGALLIGGLAILGGPTRTADAQTDTAPTLTATALNKTFLENGLAELLFSNADVSTQDAGQNLTSLVVTVTGLGEPNSERLDFNGDSVQLNDGRTKSAGGATATVSQAGTTATVVFTFSPVLNETDFETFVDGLGYDSGANIPTNGIRSITLTTLVDDGVTNNTTTLSITAATVNVIAVNDDPLLVNLPAAITVVEGVASNVDLSAATFSDIDAPPASVALTITASAGTLSGVDTGGVVATGSGTVALVLTGQPIAINNYMGNPANIQYTSQPGAATPLTLSFVANDGGNSGQGGGNDVVFQTSVTINVEVPPELKAVCIYKLLEAGSGASAATLDQFTFSAVGDVNTTPTAAVAALPIGSTSCPLPQVAQGDVVGLVEFEYLASETVTVTETSSNSAVTLTAVRNCGELSAFNTPSVILGESEGKRSCTLVNELTKVLVCVTKQLNPGAQAAGFLDPSVFAFVVTNAMSDNVPVDFPVPGCDADDQAFFVELGSRFNITETGPVGSENILGPVLEVCGGQGPDDNPPGRWTANVLPGVLACQIVNDATLLCISKAVTAEARYVLDPADVQMFVSVAGGAEQQVTLAPTSVPCDIATASPGAVVGHVYAPPGSTVAIREANVGITRPQASSLPCSNIASGQGGPIFSANPGVLDVTNLSITGVVLPSGASEYASCTITNEVAVVCVAKQFGSSAPLGTDGFNPDHFTFAMTSGPPDNPVTVPALDRAIDPQNYPCREGTAFALTPGTPFTITESESGAPAAVAGKIGLVSVGGDCDLTDGAVTGTAPTNGSPITCILTNDSLVICISKQLGDTAKAAGVLPTAATFYVQFPGEAEIELTPSTTQSGNCPEPAAGEAMAELLSAPKAPSFTLRESAPANTGFVRAYCPQGEGAQPPRNEQTTQPITISTDGGAGTFNCIFLNDSVIVCASKLLGASATSTGRFNTGDFPFTLRSGMAEITAVDVQGCEGTAYPVAPGARFELTETIATADAAEIGFVRGTCIGGSDASDDPTNGIAWNAPSDLTIDGINQIDCTLTNDTAVVCVVKSLTAEGQAAVDSGAAKIADVSFTLTVDGGTTSAPVVPGPLTDDSACSWVEVQDAGVAAFAIAPGAEYVVQELLADGSVLAPIFAQCASDAPAVNSDSASFTAEDFFGEVPNRHLCRFINHSVPLTVSKTVVNDDGGTATPQDFRFDVFDEAGAQLGDGLSVGDDGKTPPVYVKPGSKVTVAERPFDGYTTSATECSPDVTLKQALEGSTLSVYDVPSDVTSVNCPFTNNDIAKIPVCAMMTFDEGNSDLTLDAFTLEAFDGGALIGSKIASAPSDAACEPAPESGSNTASLLPGNLVLLGRVIPDGRTINFVASVNDPDGIVVFETSSCSVDLPNLVQALHSADAVAVSPGVGAIRVQCLARASANEPIVVGNSPVNPILASEPTPEPAAPAAAATAATVPIAVQAAVPIAVTGASTTDTTLPLGLAFIGTGFAMFAAYHHRRRQEL